MSWRAGIAVLACACGRLSFDDFGATADAGDAGDALAIDTVEACAFRFGAGRQHLSATFPDGTVRVWGAGTYGQIGDGFMQNRSTPTVVNLPGVVVASGAGRYETCAALASGELYCWGEGDSGQLGDGLGVTRPTPMPVSNLTGVVEVAPAAVHACARTGAGEVWCWGAGSSGRLGTGMMSSSLVPVQAINLAGVKRLIAGGSTSCAVLGDDSPRCWGYNQRGGVGINSTTDVPTPTQPIGLARVRAITTRDLSTCAVRDDGAVLCWGSNDEGQCGTTPVGTDLLVPTQARTSLGPLVGALDIGLGIEHACALLTGGEVWCWGLNRYGQLGNGSTSMVAQPLATIVSGLPEIVQIGIAAWTTCALDRDGGVWCWGLGLEGELGDGTLTVMQLVPQRAFTACP